jgi:hypothetical protein
MLHWSGTTRWTVSPKFLHIGLGKVHQVRFYFGSQSEYLDAQPISTCAAILFQKIMNFKRGYDAIDRAFGDPKQLGDFTDAQFRLLIKAAQQLNASAYRLQVDSALFHGFFAFAA